MEITFELVVAFLGSGIGASLITEGLSFLDKKLSGSPLHGMGALLVSGAAAFLVAAIQTFAAGIPEAQNFTDILAITSTIWLTSQAFFHIILKKINALHVTPDSYDPLA